MLDKMFSKGVLMPCLAGFVVFAVYGVVVQGFLLQDMYMSLPADMWRSEAESQGLMYWIFIAYALMAWVMAILRPPAIDTLVEGFQRGAILGVFLGSTNLIDYAVIRSSLSVSLTVFAVDVLMVALGGAAIAMVAGRMKP